MFTGLVSREVRARYKGSVLGFLWSLLNPLMMLVIYSVVFAVYLRVDIPNYPLFLFAGILPWQWFTSSLQNGTATIVSNGNLIKKVYFPHEILPVVNVMTNLVNYVFSLPVLVLILLISQVAITPNLLYLPLLIVIQFVLTLGIVLILCTANAFFRDVEQLLSPILMAWFYMTPVIYPPSVVPERFSFLLYLNPMAPVIAGYQQIFYLGQSPSLKLLAYSGLLGVVLFVIGYAIFYNQKFKFSEVV